MFSKYIMLFYDRLALLASSPMANFLPTSFSRKDTAFIATLPRCHVSVLAVSSLDLQRNNAHLLQTLRYTYVFHFEEVVHVVEAPLFPSQADNHHK